MGFALRGAQKQKRRFSSDLLSIIIFISFIGLFASVRAQNDVTFRLQMRVKMLERVFDPARGDIIFVGSEHPKWPAMNATVLADADRDSVFEVSLNLDGLESVSAEFNYFIIKNSGLVLREEFTPPRVVNLTGAPQALPVVFFDEDKDVDQPVTTGKVRFQLEIAPLRSLGAFNDSDGDTLKILGPFNGWGAIEANAVLVQNIYDSALYTFNATVIASPNTTVPYLFGLSENGTGRSVFETPLRDGGLRRELLYSKTAIQVAPRVYFNDVPPEGVIPSGTEISCTFSVDMRPAMQAGSQPLFDPQRDKVYFLTMDPLWRATQGMEGIAHDELVYADANGDGIYELTFDVKGPSYYGLLYRVGFGPDNSDLKAIEGGDLRLHPSRVRYIKPIAANTFPANFQFPVDIWQSGEGLPVESPPFETKPPDNKPPVVENTIPDQTIPVNSNAYNIDLAGSAMIFRDPDGDMLTYQVAIENQAIVHATISGSLLTLTPKQIGSTRLSVTADDQHGGTATTSFTVTVVEGNQPPRVINTVADQILTVDGALFTLNLSLIFEDPNGDPLTYRASSSSPTVAAAIVLTDVLRVAPKLVGTSTITITAMDNQGGEASTAFNVDVVSGNQAPRVVNPIPTQILDVGGNPYLRNLDATPRVFADPNGDILKYAVRSSNNAVAIASMSGSVMRVEAQAVGEASITVTADDQNGGVESTSFTVQTVSENANQAPKLANPIESQTLIEGGSSFSRNLDQPPTVFEDPDDDPLSYTATSNHPEVAEVTIFGSLLTVASGEQGAASIAVTATDGRGGSKTFTFDVRVVANQAPFVSHQSPVSQAVGEPMVINAWITDDTGVTSAVIHYRRGGDTQFNPIAMSLISGIWQGTIPGGDVTSRGIEYKIEAFDRHQQSGFSPLYSIPIVLSGEGESRGSSQPAGTAQSAYRLFSIPFTLHNPDPADVLLDDLGEYDIKKWRFFELLADQNYAEFGATGLMLPGKAFWLIVSSPGFTIDSGPGTTQSTLKPFRIALHPQWNFIANPFNYPIPVANLRLATTGESPALRSYNGTWSDPSEVSDLEPFSGYALFVETDAGDTLIVDPRLDSDSPKRIAYRSLQPDWAIRIIGRCQQAIDRDNLVGVAAAAMPGHDRYDRPEPPVIGEYVRIAQPRWEWGSAATDFSADIRAPFEKGAVWDFTVTSPIPEVIQLDFDGVESVPASFEVWLVDSSAGVAKNLRSQPFHQLPARRDGREKVLRLVIGTPEFLVNSRLRVADIPEDFELAQNFPNPFNPATSIRFGLPGDAKITLAVYNLLGQEVARLIDGQTYEAGYHLVVWDGKNALGIPVPTGVYFYQLQAGHVARVRKLLLVR